MDNIHTFSIKGVGLATGDLICITDGGPRPESIIFLQEIWDAYANERAGDVLTGC